MPQSLSRRDLLRAGFAAAGLAWIPGESTAYAARGAGGQARRTGPNEQVGVAFIGVGNQGSANLSVFRRQPLCRPVAVCDVYAPYRDRGLKSLGEGVVAVDDYRRLLDRKDVDAVVVSTPDHWHALPTIDACRAGKDVYVEKPLALTIAEGRAMLREARKHNRVVQMGTQQRSGRHFQEAVDFVRSGKLGKIERVETWILGGTRDLGFPADTPPPSGLDWDRWLGPAPQRAFNAALFPYNFRWFWSYAGGQMSNWGVHLLDIARWATGAQAPLRVEAEGGIKVTHDCRETPDTLDATYTFADGPPITFWHRVGNALPPDGNPKHDIGILFYGASARLFLDRLGWSVTPNDAAAPTEQHGGSDMHGAHVENFLTCVKSRRRPHSDIEIGHLSTIFCHLGNIAYRTGRSLAWDARNEWIIDSPEANAYLKPVYRSPWKL